MDTRQALEPTDEQPPASWRAASAAAAAVTLVVVLGSRGMLGAAAQVADELGLASILQSPLVRLAPLVGLAVALGAAGVVLLALRVPWLALVVAGAALVPVVLLGDPSPTAVLVLLAGVSIAGSWRRPVAGVLATGVALLSLVVGLVRQMVLTGPVGPFETAVLAGRGAVAVGWAVVLCGLLWLTLAARRQIGLAQRREHALAGLVDRASAVEQQSEVTAERARLARDLHDVVAHHVSLIAVRAETAPYTHPGLGAEARSVLAEIAADARRALDELRGVLGILGRSVDGARLPQPSWGDIAGLVERSSSSGQPVDLVGDVRSEVGPTVGYVAYRVVQEGLTNARKHAPGVPVTVRLERTAHLAVVSVASAGPPAAGPAAAPASSATPEETAPLVGLPARPASAVPPTAVLPQEGRALSSAAGTRDVGHGLVGMRERVEALGGRLVAGPRDGGFVVEATLPLADGDRR